MFNARVLSFFWITALFLAQNSLNYLFFQKAPALVLIGVLFYALSEGPSFGAVCGLWAGFLMDLFGTERPGYWMGALSMSGYFSGVISSKLFQDSFLTQILLPAIFLYGVTFAEVWILRAKAGLGVGFGIVAEAFMFWPLLVTALVSPWLFGFLRRWAQNSSGRRRPQARN